MVKLKTIVIFTFSFVFLFSCAQTRRRLGDGTKVVTKSINKYRQSSDVVFDRMEQKNQIKTNGYYFAINKWDINENNFFDNKTVVLLKFDKDGYCNVFDIPILKGKTVKSTIIGIKKRNYTHSPVNSGAYNIDGNKITVKYSIFNNPKHLFGKYVIIDYKGFIINENSIQLKVNQNDLKFKFVEDDHIRFKNYFRENTK